MAKQAAAVGSFIAQPNKPFIVSLVGFFGIQLITQHIMQSSFSSRDGWGTEKKWKKLWDRIPDHEKSDAHKNCYLLWRELQRHLENDTGINVIIEENVSSEAEKWKKLLSRIIDVVIFLGQRGLAFRGSSLRIGDVDNGNFLGLLELLAHYDPIVEEHVTKVKVAQQRGERLQATTYHQNRKTNSSACALQGLEDAS